MKNLKLDSQPRPQATGEEKGEKMTYKKYEARVLEELKVKIWLDNRTWSSVSGIMKLLFAVMAVRANALNRFPGG